MITHTLTRELATNDTLSPIANKKLWHMRDTKKDFRPDIEVDGLLVEIKTLNYDSHAPRLRADQEKASIDAKAKYLKEVGRIPLIICASTNGRLTNESHATLKALDTIRDNGMPQAGTRLLLFVGLALAQAAVSYYATWHNIVSNMAHQTSNTTNAPPA